MSFSSPVSALPVPSPPARPPLSALRQVDEADRMAAVRDYHRPGSVRDPHLDELTRLLAFICGTPMALVSIIDAQRQFLKAGFGMAVTELSRADSFCDYAMRAGDVFEISDTQLDADFQDHALAVGPPYVRFYAGVALLTPEGLPVGTLCAIDTVPHQLSHEQREALRILGRQVGAHLELSRTRHQVAEEGDKVARLLQLANIAAESGMVGSWRDEIFVKHQQRLVRVPTADISHAQREGAQVRLHTSLAQYTIATSLDQLEAQLPPRDFARVHPDFLVRLDHVMTTEDDHLLLDPVRSKERLAVAVPIGSAHKQLLISRLQQG